LGIIKKTYPRGEKMKKHLLLVFIVLLFLCITEKIGVHAAVSNGKIVTIFKDTEDITGDGKKDSITLTGIKMAPEEYKNVVIKITDSNKAHEKINLPNGYNPSLQFIDVNQDGVMDIFGSVNDSKRGAKSHQIVYTAKNLKTVNLGLPAPLILESHFLNDYKAKINIRKTGDNYIIDLKKRKEYYEKLGVFYNGKLNEPTELMVHDYNSFKPVQIGGHVGLKGTQKVTGVTDSDTIGFVESTWKFEHSEWILANVVVLKKM
jgi:hypothetical protein